MAQIPSISEIYNSIISQLEAELGITIPTFGKVFLNALALTQAAKLKLIWLSVASVQKNVFVDTADPESSGGTLERFGRVKLNRERFAATQGKYEVAVTGLVAATVPAGTIFKSNDDSASPGKLFILDVEKILGVPVDSMELRALVAGIDSRLVVGNILTSTQPLINIDDEVLVTVENEIPLTEETVEEYREKTITAFQLEAKGGAATDYRLWSLDAQGVRKTYPYAKSGECAEINLYVEATQADSTDGKGTPTAQILTDVEAVVEFDPDTTQPIEERGRRPLGVFEIFFLAISPKDVEITFVNAVNFTTETETAITDALTQEIDNIRPFIDASDIESDRNDTLDINKMIGVSQELLSGNQKFDTITMTVDSVPVTTSIQFLNGDIPFLIPIIF